MLVRQHDALWQSIAHYGLVTGAGRGLGLQIVKTLSTRPDTIVFAGVRSWPLDSEDQLTKLAAVSPNVVFPIKLTSADEMDNLAAASVVKDKVGKVDVIVANAGKLSVDLACSSGGLFWRMASGTSTGITPLSTVKPAQMRSDFETNTIGPVVLFQAFAPLLSSSDAPGGAKFVIISAILGQIEDSLPYQYNAYGISKAGANYIAKKLNQTIPDLISFPIQYVLLINLA
jgi:NAD(P)-dependent dehydrogenase (short-subunit alcohol dehydrogenase family)